MEGPKMLQPTESFVVHYQEAVEFTNNQLKIFWLPDEIKVEKDVHDILTNITEAEKHGIITTLRLFTLYELRAGADYWGSRFMKMFPRPEFARMGSAFAMMELAVHKPFYNKINELLFLNTDAFYLDYVNDPVLSERMKFIDEVVNNEDPLISLGVFSMVEGAILYSSFAFLKHFKSKGKNKLNNIVRGLNFGVRDENLHSQGSAWAFRTLLGELNYSDEQKQDLFYKISVAADELLVHEKQIVDMIFSKGDIEGITKEQMYSFVESRINLCLEQLGMSPKHVVEENPIADWFYKGINDYVFNDFFAGQGREYKRDWDETSFTW